jgi:hypothetical protein
MAELLVLSDLPAGFSYPSDFVRVVELGLIDLEPWEILLGDRLRQKVSGLRERYPRSRVVPFAARQDNDDVACWDVDTGAVAIVHDYASPGWERRHPGFGTFNDWFRQAIEDLIEFGP